MSDEPIARFKEFAKAFEEDVVQLSLSKKTHGQPGYWEADPISHFEIPGGSVPWEKKLEDQV